MSGDLDHLGKQIDELKAKHAPGPEEVPSSGMGQAMQMGIEFVSCVGVGTVIGYFLDRWLDTQPIFLMVCLLLGAGAGFRTMIKSARATSEETE